MNRRLWRFITDFAITAMVVTACGSSSSATSGIAPERTAATESAVVQATKPAASEPATTTERTATPEPTPAPQETNNQPFLMWIDDVFAIKGRGTVVTGQVARGTIQVGDAVEIVSPQDKILKTVVTGVEMLYKTQDQATPGDNVGLLLRGIEADQVMPGMILAQAGAFTSYADALLDLEAAGFASGPPETSNEQFLMQIDDVFAIKGRGTVVTGHVARGTIQVGDEVEIISPQDTILKTVVTGVEMLHKTQDQATAGDNVGILLRGIEADQVMPGMILAQAGAFTSYAEALRNLK